jgi:hypothetical protein
MEFFLSPLYVFPPFSSPSHQTKIFFFFNETTRWYIATFIFLELLSPFFNFIYIYIYWIFLQQLYKSCWYWQNSRHSPRSAPPLNMKNEEHEQSHNPWLTHPFSLGISSNSIFVFLRNLKFFLVPPRLYTLDNLFSFFLLSLVLTAFHLQSLCKL